MCGYMSQFESVQNKIRNGYLFKVCFCRLLVFCLSYSFKLFPYTVSKNFFQHSNSDSQVYFGVDVKMKLFLCMQTDYMLSKNKKKLM